MSFAMRDGDKVVVCGTVDVYERDGRYQLYARRITPEGTGDLYGRFLALKAELEEMGMFAPEYKHPIPKYVKRLGVVTAPTGAAVQDIRNIALRRNPYVQIILYPALVQGEGAADSICRGIRMLDEAGVDVIIVGRGGGSIEDLWAFNEEKVARAVFACGTPVISAVGHETDFTIVDFVADLRAPTPSAAAELAVFDYQGVADAMQDSKERLTRAMEGRLSLLRGQAEHYRLRLQYLSPERLLREKRQCLADLENGIRVGMDRKLDEKRGLLEVYLEKFAGLSPLRKLSRGYSYVASAGGRAITRVSEVKTGDLLSISVTDGTIEAEVRQVKEERIWTE